MYSLKTSTPETFCDFQVEATKKLCNKVKNNELSIDSITPELLQNHLLLQNCPDLIVRTSGTSFFLKIVPNY